MKILIVEDHLILADGLSFILKKHNQDTVINHAATFAEAIHCYNHNVYDLVIMDINLGEQSGLDLIVEFRKLEEKQRIIVLTMHNEISIVSKVLELNVNGFIIKGADSKELLKAIKTVQENGEYFSPEILKLTKSIDLQESKISLTPREKEVLDLIAQEYTNDEIAKQLSLAKRTVDGHRQRMLEKFNARNTVGLIRSAMHLGLIE